MDGPSTPISWTPITRLHRNFSANVHALQTRYPALAETLANLSPQQTYYILPSSDRIQLGVAAGVGVTPLASVLPPENALDMLKKLCPAAACDQPVLVAGEDLGWLWNGLYHLPCNIPAAPRHRPPLFFLMNQIERLWVLLHLHDWQTLLVDPRVRLFVGSDAFEQFRQSLVADATCPWPRLSVRVDQSLWAGTMTLDEILRDIAAQANQKFLQLQEQLRHHYAGATPQAVAARLSSGQPLKILGITSRYTTFLQYSMRDWLAAFEGLGHRTHLLIEADHYQLCNTLTVSAACEQFKPDLVVIIDHYRRELGGIPEHLPVVMWIQDRMPNIHRPQAGRVQQRMDYCLGYGRVELTQRMEYPASRFMPAMLGINADRFSAVPMSEHELAPYRCDVSFVSNATIPADQIVRQELQRNATPEARRLLDDVYQRLCAIYDAGNSLTAGDALRSLILQTMADNRLTADVSALLELFTHRVNNALFRHQAIRWVAEMGVDLRLYGNGWENHPEFARFARGIADNITQLPAIYQASAINLQVTPFGAVHQRLLDGLAAGGFFLVRSVTGDEVELVLRDIWNWRQSHGARTGCEMLAKRDEKLAHLFRRFKELTTIDPAEDPDYYFAAIEECAMTGFTRTVNTLFDEHDRVTFSTQEQLTAQMRHFLASADERRNIAHAMRARVLETHTYTAISRRLLAFIAADLSQTAGNVKQAA